MDTFAVPSVGCAIPLLVKNTLKVACVFDKLVITAIGAAKEFALAVTSRLTTGTFK